MRALYTLATYLAVPFVCAGMLWRSLREPAYRRGFAERFGLGAANARDSIWVHAASVGEVHAAEALIRALRREYPGWPVTLTTMTPAGAERAGALFGAAVQVRLIPFDLPGAVARFLRRTRPRLAVILETELWPNLYLACGRRGVPIVIASARVSERSARRYLRVAGLSRALFSSEIRVAAQSSDDAQRFMAIGASPTQTSVAGNLKFDFEVPPGVRERGAALRERYAPARPCWVAGSTHETEEQMLLEAHRLVRRQYSEAVLVLVPRHRNRFGEVAAWLASSGARFVTRSAGGAYEAGTEVLLVDTLGELLDFYQAGDVAFVGGTLVRVGGHNLLEPAALARPILIGPHYSNTADVAALLLAADAIGIVANAAALANAVAKLFGDSRLREERGAAARAVVEANRGAVQKVLRLIAPLLAAQEP